MRFFGFKLKFFYFGAIFPIKSGEDASFPSSPALELDADEIPCSLRFLSVRHAKKKPKKPDKF